MFTGLVEEIGAVKSVVHLGGGRRISFEASKITSDLKIDDSVSVNGVCQTVVSKLNSEFVVETIEETVSKTTLGSFVPGKRVNLERAITLSSRLGGHIVQGHVDTTGTVLKVEMLSTGKNIWIEFPKKFEQYIVATGSITIDGVSLTAARVETGKFMVSIIPHSWKNTTLSELKPGIKVNLEFDILGKYLEKLFLLNKIGTNIDKNISNLNFYLSQPDI